MEIRKATTEDLTSIASHYGARGETPWDPFCDAKRLRQIPLEGLWVARADGEYAGFLYWFLGRRPWFDPQVDQYAHILEVHVLPRFQGRGIGKMLLAHALARIEDASVEAVYVDTTEENAAARRLYEEAGFRPLFRTVHYRLGREG